MGFIKEIKDMAKEILIYGIVLSPIWAPLTYLVEEGIYENHKTRVRFAKFYQDKK